MVLGAIYRDMLAFQEAQYHHEAVFKIVQDLHAPLLLRMVTEHLASTYVASNALDLADKVLQRVLVPDLPSLSIGQRLVWCAKAELCLANDQAEVALEIVERLTAHSQAARLEYLKGEALRLMGRQSAAEAALRSADQIAQIQGILSLRWRTFVSLGKCYQAQGRHEQADDAFSNAQAIVEDIVNRISDAPLRDNFLLRANERIDLVYHPSPRRAAKRAFDGLTAREREIAALIAEGKSNRAIADTLSLSERTVAKHVENILSKLSFESRTQIAAWAVEKGLHKS